MVSTSSLQNLPRTGSASSLTTATSPDRAQGRPATDNATAAARDNAIGPNRRQPSSVQGSSAPRNSASLLAGRPAKTVAVAVATPAVAGGFAAAFPKEEFKPVPKLVHMIWVGSQPGPDKVKYLKNWAEKNPGMQVNIWMDSKHLGAYAANQAVGAKIAAMFPNPAEFAEERTFRGLFSQLGKAAKNPGKHGESALRQSLKELNEELSKPARSALKHQLLPQGGPVTAENMAQAAQAYGRHARKNDEKFMQVDRMILDQTAKAWDRAKADGGPVGQGHPDLHAMQHEFDRLVDSGNIKVRDFSDPADMPGGLVNQDAYLHGIVGRKGAYPESSDIARYELLHKFGGVYTDMDIECLTKLGDVQAHPALMLVALDEAKRDGHPGEFYVQNALLASHPGSQTVGALVDKIKDTMDNMNGNEFEGSRYFDRPNKITIEISGPAGLRGHLENTIRAGNGQPQRAPDSEHDAETLLKRADNPDFWAAFDSHLTFPPGLVEFDTYEQLESATKDMATFDGGLVGKRKKEAEKAAAAASAAGETTQASSSRPA